MQSKELKTIANRINGVFKGSKKGNSYHVLNNGRLKLRAENWDGFIEWFSDGKINETEFSYSVPKSDFEQLLSASGEVELSPNGEDCIESGRLKIKVERGQKYDFWNHSNPVLQAIIPADRLKDMIKKSVFATDENATRYAFNGVAIVQDKNGFLVFFATDGRIMSTVFELHQGSIVNFPNVESWGAVPIVHANHLKAVSKILPKKGNVTIAIRQNCIQLEFGEYKCQFRLIEGRFPNCYGVIDDLNEKRKLAFSTKSADELSNIIESNSETAIETDKKGKTVLGQKHYDLVVDSDSNKMIIGKNYLRDAVTGADNLKSRLGSDYTTSFLANYKNGDNIDCWHTGPNGALWFETFDCVFVQMPMSLK